MIDDMLTPCEDAECVDIGGVRCMICSRTYCEEHIDRHECELQRRIRTYASGKGL